MKKNTSLHETLINNGVEETSKNEIDRVSNIHTTYISIILFLLLIIALT